MEVRGGLRLLAAILVAVAVPSFSVAQESAGLRDRDPVLSASKRISSDLQKATAHYGPFYLLSSIELGDVGFNQEYFMPTADQVDALSFSVSAPQRLYFVPRRKTVFSLDVVPQYALVRTAAEGGDPLDDRRVTTGQFGYTARADAMFLLNHLYLDFFASTSDRLTANTAEINRLVTRDEHDFGLNSEIKYSSRTSMLVNGTFRRIRHPGNRLQPDDVPVELLDRDERNFRTSFIHRTFARTSLFAAAELSDYSFQRTTYKSSQRRYVAPGFAYDSGRTTWRVEIGPGQLLFDNPTQKDFRGILGSTQASKHLGNRWQLSASAARDVDFSIFGDNNYLKIDRAQLLAEMNVTRRFSLRFSGQVGRDSYDIPVDGVLRRDTMRYGAIGWLYTFRKLRGGFDIGYYDRNSNYIQGDEQDGIRYVLHLSLTP